MKRFCLDCYLFSHLTAFFYHSSLITHHSSLEWFLPTGQWGRDFWVILILNYFQSLFFNGFFGFMSHNTVNSMYNKSTYLIAPLISDNIYDPRSFLLVYGQLLRVFFWHDNFIRTFSANWSILRLHFYNGVTPYHLSCPCQLTQFSSNLSRVSSVYFTDRLYWLLNILFITKLLNLIFMMGLLRNFTA